MSPVAAAGDSVVPRSLTSLGELPLWTAALHQAEVYEITSDSLFSSGPGASPPDGHLHSLSGPNRCTADLTEMI